METGLQISEIRCGKCRRKLGEGVYTRLAIKCPRCRAFNTLRAERPHPERHGTPKPESDHDTSQVPLTTGQTR